MCLINGIQHMSCLRDGLAPERSLFRLETIDKQYQFNPSELEWEMAKIVHNCVHNFHEATRHLSGSKYPTFSYICLMHLKMIEWTHSEHDFIRIMTSPMKDKFDKYWDECCLVLAVAVVFDSRFKMSLVEYFYIRIYGSSADRYIRRVHDTLMGLFFTYGDSRVSSANQTTAGSSSIIETDDFDFERWYDESRGSVNEKSELGSYLDETRFPRTENFSVLDWWRINSPRLPILARIARDILVVPATTITSEAAFGVEGRVIDESHACLHPNAVEALIVADEWIRPIPKKGKKGKSILFISYI